MAIGGGLQRLAPQLDLASILRPLARGCPWSRSELLSIDLKNGAPVSHFMGRHPSSGVLLLYKRAISVRRHLHYL